MIELGLSEYATLPADCPGVHVLNQNGSARLRRQRENVKNSFNRQCVLCGSDRMILQIHHVRKREHGSTDAARGVVPTCPACHLFIHGLERGLSLAARVNLALQLLGPAESLRLMWVCRFVFRVFLRSTAATTFHPASLRTGNSEAHAGLMGGARDVEHGNRADL